AEVLVGEEGKEKRIGTARVKKFLKVIGRNI
ncbi:hypothetical protein LCGC14_2822470, partial [marine sediment metagenome]